MWMLITLPFFFQALVIGVDEYYFHIKRGLPRWERIGHPIDTFSILLCFAFVFLAPYTQTNLWWYLGLSLFSCLLVTKDEFVHKHHCPASEQWLHALLFINHPIMLAALGLIWPVIQGSSSFFDWINAPAPLFGFLIIQALITTGFFLYQVIYWNFIWKEKTETPQE